MKKALIIGILLLVSLTGCTTNPGYDEPPVYEFETDYTTIASRDIMIPATIIFPKGDTDQKYPLVVMAHGHGGSREEAGSFTSVAEGLAKKGIATIRMEFPGCGESTEGFVENNPTNMLADIKSSLNHMVATSKIDENKIAILGYSMGGRLALLSLDNNDVYKAIAMWAPAGTNGSDSILNFFGGEEAFINLKAKAKTDGSTMFTTPWGQEQELGYKFFTDMEETKPLDAIAEFSGPVLVIYGDKDNIIVPDVAKAVVEAAKKSSDAKGHEIIGADHGFGLFSNEPELSQELVDTTVDFFIKSLK